MTSVSSSWSGSQAGKSGSGHPNTQSPDPAAGRGTGLLRRSKSADLHYSPAPAAGYDVCGASFLQRLSEIQLAVGRVGEDVTDLEPDLRRLTESVISAVTRGNDAVLSDTDRLRSEHGRLAHSLRQLESELQLIRSQVESIVSQPAPACPRGGTIGTDGRCYTCPTLSVLHTDNNCYSHSFGGRFTYERAADRCRNAGLGNLATMTAENRELLYLLARSIVSPKRAWFGLSSPSGVDGWVWEDGSPYGDFTDWENGMEPPVQPNVRTCATLGATLSDRWNTASCTEQSPFICQIPATVVL